LIEISQLVLEKTIFIKLFFFTLSLLSLLGEGCSPLFKLTWIPYPHDWFATSLIKIGPVVLEKKMKMWKSLQMHGQTNKKSSLVLCAQVS
jgi:hypothetical protein